MSNIELGDLVKDGINGYEGVVFGIEPDGDKTFVHFKRTFNAWQLCEPRLGTPHRINIKNIVLLKKRGEHNSHSINIDDKVDLILNYLGLEIITEPAKAIIKKAPPPKENI